jgi:hypothetical protein
MKARAAAIHAAKRGSVFAIEDASETPVSAIESADALYDKLAAGAVWVDTASPAAPLKPALPGATGEQRQKLLAAAATPVAPAADGFPVVAIPAAGTRVPLAGKLDQESLLRALPGDAAIHPATAQRLNIKAGARLHVESEQAQCPVTVRLSDAVMQGVVEISPGAADTLDLFATAHGSALRAVRVRLGRA